MVSPKETAARLQALHGQYAAGITGAGLIGGTLQSEVLHRLGWQDVAFLETPRIDGTTYCIDLRTTMRVQDGAQAALDSLEAWFGVLALQLGQRLKEHDYFDKRPLFEFVRHVRNAVAHDNAFDIRRPQRPAEFQGLIIEQSLHGAPLSGFMSVGDLLALIDAVISDLNEMDG